MRIAAAIFASLLMLVATSRNGLNILIYQAAKPIIIEKYCVNKDKVELSCNGKCHLAEMMAASENDAPDDAPLPAPEFKFQDIVFMAQAGITAELNENHTLVIYRRQDLADRLAVADIFHPPQG